MLKDYYMYTHDNITHPEKTSNLHHTHFLTNDIDASYHSYLVSDDHEKKR